MDLSKIYEPLWQIGDCFRHKKPYNFEPEYMIVDFHKDGYKAMCLQNGKPSYLTVQSYMSVHVFYENLSTPELTFKFDLENKEFIDSL